MSKYVNLPPGGLFLSQSSATISTLLGSCVSLTMRHVESGMCAMCHCLLPKKPVGSQDHGDENRHAYLDATVDKMISFFTRAGHQPGQLEVKLFGGSDVLQIMTGPKSVGQLNIQRAQELVEHYRLRVSAADLGGPKGRQIVFESSTGHVLVKKVGAVEKQAYSVV